MARVDGSVYTGSTAIGSGTYTINMPEPNLTIVGVQSAGIFAISIPINPSENAILFFASAGGIVPKYFRCNISVKGQILNYTIIAGNGNLTFLYGKPDSKDPTGEQLAGVTGSSVFSAVGSQNITLNFPTAKKLTGMAMVLSASGTQAELTFSTSSGASMNIGAYSNQVGGNDTIVPIDDIPTATNLTVAVYSFAAQTVYLVAYYK